MKDFITSIASIILLMIFVMQFATNQAVYTKLVQTESCVSLFRDSAQQQGEILPADIQNLKKRAAPILDCTPEEIRIDAGESKAGESGYNISYDISVPLKNIIGAAKLLGISQEENEAEYHFRGTISGRGDEEETVENIDNTQKEAANEEHDNDNGDNDSILRAPEIPDGA